MTAPAEMRLGSNTLLVLEDPPGLGETRDIVIRVRCTLVGDEQQKVDGDETHFCRNKIVTAWELGKPKPPDPNADQGSLYDEPKEDGDGEVDPPEAEDGP